VTPHREDSHRDRGFDRYKRDTISRAQDLGHRGRPADIALGSEGEEDAGHIARQMQIQRLAVEICRDPTLEEIQEALGKPKVTKAPAIAAKVELMTAAVPDPIPDPNRKVSKLGVAAVRAQINRRVDILEHERSHKRITAAAYRTGRVAQAVFERAHLGGASTWAEGSRVDTSRAKEMAIVRKLLNSRTIKAHLEWIRDVLGSTDAEVVRQVIGENRRYGEVRIPHPHLLGLDHGYSITIIAHRFRYALETLAASRKDPPETDGKVPALRKFVCAKCRRNRIVNPSFPDDYTPTICTPCLDMEEPPQ
jgi:hypothetical protein